MSVKDQDAQPDSLLVQDSLADNALAVLGFMEDGLYQNTEKRVRLLAPEIKSI